MANILPAEEPCFRVIRKTSNLRWLDGILQEEYLVEGQEQDALKSKWRDIPTRTTNPDYSR